MEDQARADIIRRVTEEPTRPTRGSLDSDCLPIDRQSMEELIWFSFRTRLNYSAPPLSADAVLHTIYRCRYKHISSVIEPCHEATRSDCVRANMFILWTLKIDLDTFQGFLHRIRSDCCFRTHGTVWIAKIRMISGAEVPTSWFSKPPPARRMDSYSMATYGSKSKGLVVSII